ncbi:MAG: capsule assembly Wzi family protein [Bacteroidota bacterium]
MVYEPTYKTVYGYLSRLAQKGVIDLDDVISPLSRAYIAVRLDSVTHHKEQLTSLEKQELLFYLKEYTLERNIEEKVELITPYKSVFHTQQGDRFRWGAYQDQQFSINAQPILGYEGEFRNDGTVNHHTWRGAWVYGYIGKSIGFSFDVRDNTEKGDSIDTKKAFTPTTGVIGVSSSPNNFEYSEVRGSISARWKWGSVSVGKDFLNWGYGEGGKIVLSQKAPSFPMIRLDVRPVKWLIFNYQHAWLNSNIIDSTTLTKTLLSGYDQFYMRDKLMASHSITFIPTKGLSVSVGETAIYNNGVKLPFLIPVLFFRLVDHYLGGLDQNPNISNSQIFFQFSSRNQLKKTHLYFSYFVDEISLGTLYSEGKVRNQTAYTGGMSIADFIVPNLSLTLEYSKIRPYAYVNRVLAQSYKSSDYYLGHWIGPNADQFYGQIYYRAARGLTFKGVFEYIRKGEEGADSLQSGEASTPFLGGKVNKYMNVSLEAKYELIHDLFFKMVYSTKMQSINITSPMEKNYQIFSFGFNYGF